MKITFHTNDTGKLMGYIDGKVCFPDRAFTNACEGPAEVHFTREFDKYSFVDGEMIRFDTPAVTIDDLIDSMFQDNFSPNSIVLRIEHPVRGNYYAMYVEKTHQNVLRIREDPETHRREVVCEYVAFSDLMYVKESQTILEIALYHAFASETEINQIFDTFHASKYARHTPNFYKLDASWEITESLPDNTDIDFEMLNDALNCKLLSIQQLMDNRNQPYSTTARIVVIDELAKSIDFSKEELIDLFTWASACNKQADEYIESQCHKGKIPIKVTPKFLW